MLEQINMFVQEPDFPNPTDAINNVYKLPSIGRSIRFIHAAASFPTRATWIKEIHKENYILWPLINVNNVENILPKSEETQKGHMCNHRQGVRPTRRRQARQSSKYKNCTLKTDRKSAPEDPVEPIEKKQDIFIDVYETKDTMYTDQTGKFPVRYSREQQYQLVAHHLDSNWFLVKMTKKRTEGDLIAARHIILERMKEQGIVPKHQVLDNEISKS